MRLYEFHTANNYFLLTESERNNKKDQLLGMLSDEDLEILSKELSESLEEADPRNPNAYRPKDPLAGGIKARYPNLSKTGQERAPEISKAVNTMPKDHKAELKKVVKKELSQRQKIPKTAASSGTNSLKKVVKSLGALALAGAVAYGAGQVDTGADNVQPNASDTAQVSQQVSSPLQGLSLKDIVSTPMGTDHDSKQVDTDTNKISKFFGGSEYDSVEDFLNSTEIKSYNTGHVLNKVFKNKSGAAEWTMVTMSDSSSGHLITLKPGDNIDDLVARFVKAAGKTDGQTAFQKAEPRRIHGNTYLIAR